MTFQELRLAEPIVRAVAAKGYSNPTPIQSKAIPVIIEGQDVLGCAQTGTGKTCAFALPILHRLSASKGRGGKSRSPRALVLCPTRELAMQIFESFIGYGQNLKLRHAVVFGGVSQGKQVRSLRAGVDVLVATPGRLLDLINQGHIDLSQIETLVLDEADRMLDMGFIHDIRKVIDMIPEDRQTLFFSATVSRDIHRLSNAILHEPVVLETAPESTTAKAIEQRVYMVDRADKSLLLERILHSGDVGRVLVFSKTKHGADKLVKVLNRSEIDAEALHGDKSQNARTRTMRRFKTGATKVLVATDIASRGIDVDDITHVINYDMPIDPETYVHRIGRTARAGSKGIAISMCDHSEQGILYAIEKRTREQIEVGQDNQDITFTPRPRQSRGNGGGQGGKPRYQGTRKPKTGGRSRKAKFGNDTAQSGSKQGGKQGKKKNRAGKSNASGSAHKTSMSGRVKKSSIAARKKPAGRSMNAARH